KVEEDFYNYVYYDDSFTLKQLRRYPFYQLGIVALFILVSYFAFSYSRRSEQNQVWAGMAKETAHQLGTPMSSLMGWVELIEEDQTQATPEALEEMRKDIDRLKVITERFSKIGSTPVMQKEEFSKVLNESIKYMKTRSSDKVIYRFEKFDDPTCVETNVHLFEWVIENLCKNAMDAMGGVGTITFKLKIVKDNVVLDVTDTGKGIPHNQFKTIFKPGFTTKKRGWGLGLSLVKRIVENYHNGHIIVKESIPGKRTTFRIILKAC
ncbi:MAG: HAMP domain-containing histidine kinase, partial [Bacteroidia bacterium]|nr:HAMP domain-containing histidine kinase [Bacteroidia bacterium]